MIPIEVTQAPWHATGFGDWVDHWQTLIAGGFALLAGIVTVVVTMIIARRQIAASRKEADRVIAATRAQTEVTAEQTATTVRLERERVANEDRAFRAMLEAAMARVLEEADGAKTRYASLLQTLAAAAAQYGTQTTDSSADALIVRNCITKGAFAELRAACVRLGGPLTGEFPDLEREIDSFASKWEEKGSFQAGMPPTIRMGQHAGLGKQLDVIVAKATALRDKAAKGTG